MYYFCSLLKTDAKGMITSQFCLNYSLIGSNLFIFLTFSTQLLICPVIQAGNILPLSLCTFLPKVITNNYHGLKYLVLVSFVLQLSPVGIIPVMYNYGSNVINSSDDPVLAILRAV